VLGRATLPTAEANAGRAAATRAAAAAPEAAPEPADSPGAHGASVRPPHGAGEARAPSARAAGGPGGDDPAVACVAALAQQGARARPAPLRPQSRVHPDGGEWSCGAADAVRLDRGPTGVRWGGARVSCELALALAQAEPILQATVAEALERPRLGAAPVVRVEQLGTYACRAIRGIPGMASEHAGANAIDLTRLVLRDGSALDVARDWGDPQRAAPDGARGRRARALRRLAHALFSTGAMQVVLGPAWDRAHHDHLHLDRAAYRVDGTGGGR